MTPDDLAWRPAWELRQLIARREVSVTEVTRHFLERIERLEPHVHAFLTVAKDHALADAHALDRQMGSGVTPGLLFGIPTAMKDLYWTAGIRTTGGSLLYRDHVPNEDSVYAARIKIAGGVIIGKTNTPEFGLSFRTRNELGPETLNPWDPSRICGGSSGGTAAAVAAGMVPQGLGGDSAGSTRIPAAFCGVVGLHPSNGRVPKHGGFGGMLPFFSSVGPVTRDVRDAAALLQALAGPDSRDPTSLRTAPPDYLATIEHGIAGARIAWIADIGLSHHATAAVVEAVRAGVWRLEEAGACVEEVPLNLDLPRLWEALATVADADRYALHGRVLYENTHNRDRLATNTRERLAAGQMVSGATYSAALRTRFECIRRLERVCDDYQLLACPTVSLVPPTLDELSGPAGQRDMFAYVATTFLANLTGFAAATLPAGFVSGAPVGLQLMAPPDGEPLLLRAARVFEQLRPWSGERPPLGEPRPGSS